MNVRNALNYGQSRMNKLNIKKYDWREEYLKIPISPINTFNRFSFNTSDYIYLLDNDSYKIIIFNTTNEPKLQIISSYSFAQFFGFNSLGINSVFDVKGLNEFTGNIKVKFINPIPKGTETFLSIPILRFTPICK